jgi:molybdate/tungstate transport system substrate-binding protein
MDNAAGTPTRRSVLASIGTALTMGGAGCADIGRDTTSAVTGSPGTDPGEKTVAILAAGSLQNALTNGLKPAVDVPVEIETHGSATVARLITHGQRDPDIVSVADVSLFSEPLSPAWHAVFTSNSLVLAYNPDTDGGKRLAEAAPGRWYGPLVEGSVTLGRTDPDLDPLGYRTLFMFDLATRYYDGAPDLREAIPAKRQIYPETSLLSQFETGAIDAAVAYQNMAVERNYDYVELPAQINLSDPAYTKEWYMKTAYTLPNGVTVRGGPISYASTLRTRSEPALDVFATHIMGSYLRDHGFLVRDQYPVYHGDVPARVRDATSEGNRHRRSYRRRSLTSPC